MSWSTSAKISDWSLSTVKKKTGPVEYQELAGTDQVGRRIHLVAGGCQDADLGWIQYFDAVDLRIGLGQFDTLVSHRLVSVSSSKSPTEKPRRRPPWHSS